MVGTQRILNHQHNDCTVRALIPINLQTSSLIIYKNKSTQQIYMIKKHMTKKNQY